MALFTGRTIGFLNGHGSILNAKGGGIFSGRGLLSGSGVPVTFDEAMEDGSGKVEMEDGSGFVRMEQP